MTKQAKPRTYMKFIGQPYLLLELESGDLSPGDILIFSCERIAAAVKCKIVECEPCDCILPEGTYLTESVRLNGKGLAELPEILFDILEENGISERPETAFFEVTADGALNVCSLISSKKISRITKMDLF